MHCVNICHIQHFVTKQTSFRAAVMKTNNKGSLSKYSKCLQTNTQTTTKVKLKPLETYNVNKHTNNKILASTTFNPNLCKQTIFLTSIQSFVCRIANKQMSVWTKKWKDCGYGKPHTSCGFVYDQNIVTSLLSLSLSLSPSPFLFLSLSLSLPFSFSFSLKL